MEKSNKLVSVVIPVYNEQETIGDCLRSLAVQSYDPLEIILVDDGSTDRTLEIIAHSLRRSGYEGQARLRRVSSFQLLHQKHKGPGSARNLGASQAKGEILVFVDADMTFDKNFIRDLVKPILAGDTIGTFSKSEMVANQDNIWSVCWNINRNLPPDRMLPTNYPSHAPVFRAIAKTEFDKVGGFETTGEYTDDWSLSRKLGVQSTVAAGATYYHKNPSTLKEVFQQARWIGKNEFITGSFLQKLRSLIQYSLPVSLMVAITKSMTAFNFYFLIFKLIYDAAVWISVIKSFFGEHKFKN